MSPRPSTFAQRVATASLAAMTVAVPLAVAIPSSAVASTTTTMWTTGKTNFRTAPSTSASIFGQAAAGVEITGTLENGWIKISSPQAFAGKYISADVLTSTEPTYGQPKATMYASKSASVRQMYFTTSPVIDTIPLNTKVTGEVIGTWMHITEPSQYAGKWIELSQLNKSETSVEQPKPPVTSLEGGTLGPGSVMYSGYSGVKVYLAQKALGLSYSPMGTVLGPNTIAAVKAFQAKNGLPETGNIDQATWDKLNTGYDFGIDNWIKSSEVTDSMTRDQKVKAMIDWGMKQEGKPYMWGGTGPMGFDCSGFLLQMSRAGGFFPKNVSNFTDVRPASDLAHQMMIDPEFEKGSLSDLHVGDFIYYGNSDGVAHHISVYIGNNQVLSAVDKDVHISSLSTNFGWGQKLGVNRALAL